VAKKRSRPRFSGECRCCRKVKINYARGLCKWCFDRHRHDYPVIGRRQEHEPHNLVLDVLMKVYHDRIGRQEPVKRGDDYKLVEAHYGD
jgi:hypothetical protein